jgi:hypothetical protein
MGQILEEELANAGYKLLGTQNNKEQLILNILKTKDIRYLKAIPFLIYQYGSDMEQIYHKTPRKEIFCRILEFTKRIFIENNINMVIPNLISSEDKNSSKINLNYDEFKQEFDLQRFNAEKPTLIIEKQRIYAERDLQMWLSKLFTKKERQIIKRILAEKPVSRTDYEYYSRKTKKKLNGIINLQEIARTLYTKSPSYDENLFRLKKLLEIWLESLSEYKNIDILSYFISEDKISISFNQEKKPYSQEQRFNTIRKLSEIKDNEILALLKTYKEADFS